jgi:nitrogen PTS system EIIA component
MKISDLLSPTDVLIDVRASNKRLLLQELAAKAAASLNLRVIKLRLIFSSARGSDLPGWVVASPFRMPGCRICKGLTGCLRN